MKTRIFILSIVVIMLLTFFSANRSFAEGKSIYLFPERVDLSAFPQITLLLSAWDASGLPLANLAAGQFTIQEDHGVGFQPQSVQADSQAQLSVVLVVDISGSMSGQPLQDAKVAAARFLDRLTPGDQVALIAFSDKVSSDAAITNPESELNFSADLAQIYDLVENLSSGGETRLYNAAEKAVKLFEDVPLGHRAILLLSDGRNEPADLGNPETAIILAKQKNIPFFVIGLGNQIDLPYLQRLANETGGLFRAAPRSSELASLFNDMANLLKTQYVVIYTSSIPMDGEEHQLKLTLNAAGSMASADIQISPLLLPAPVATDIPLSSPTLLPTDTLQPTISTLILPTNTAGPSIPASNNTPPPRYTQLQWGWLIAACVVIGLTLIFSVVLVRRRKASRKIAERCAKCGYDMTGLLGPCPQCGEIRRLAKPTNKNL
jgi:Mg-chelatase subunit ChlD